MMSSRKNEEKLAVVDMQITNQSLDGEPQVEEINLSKIYDSRSKKLHKSTERELEARP